MNKRNIELSLLQKILFSIFPVLAFVFFIDSFFFLAMSWDFYLKSWVFLFILMIIQTIFLFKRILQKNITADKKAIYCVLSLSVVLFQLYYIWYLDSKYIWRKIN